MDYCLELSIWCLLINLSSYQAAKVSINGFLIYFLLFNILLGVGPFFASQYGMISPLIPHFWLLFFAFSVLTLSIHLVAHWRMAISNKASGQVLLGSITVKLLFCMILVFIYLSKMDINPTLFLLNFFYLYFFHTVFEVYCLLRNLRNQILK